MKMLFKCLFLIHNCKNNRWILQTLFKPYCLVSFLMIFSKIVTSAIERRGLLIGTAALTVL